MKIGVIGTGYVGLVVGVCLAENGNTVHCVDNDARKIDALLGGRIPIYEPGLDEMLPRNVREERLFFTTDLPAASAAWQSSAFARPLLLAKRAGRLHAAGCRCRQFAMIRR